jgi:hypothetical protein
MLPCTSTVRLSALCLRSQRGLDVERDSDCDKLSSVILPFPDRNKISPFFAALEKNLPFSTFWAALF